MDALPIRVSPDQLFELLGQRFAWEQAGKDILLIPQPPRIKVLDRERKTPILRHQRIEPAGD